MSREDLTFADVSAPEVLAALNRRLGADLVKPPTIRHVFDWIRVDVPNRAPRLLALLGESEGRVRWYLPLAAYPYKLRLRLGPATLWRAGVTRVDSRDLQTLYSGVSALAEAEAEAEARILLALSRLRRELPADAILFFASIPENSAATRAFAESARRHDGYLALRYGSTYMHRKADISGGLEAYLARLGSKTRADLRRTRRRFLETTGGDTELFVAKTDSDLDRLVDTVLSVAPSTWQYRQENAGPRDRSALLHKGREALRRNMLRSYVLYAEKQPIAFQIGYVSNGVFEAHEIGYDPAWRRSQPGIVLHMSVVEDLGNSAPEVRCFDFGITDRLHKARLSTEASEGGFYYLLPNSIRGRLLHSGLRSTMALTDRLKVLKARLAQHRRA
ncbi:MAG: GNAT family N-acetyltransferase [Sedimenticolaceae bacterium]